MLILCLQLVAPPDADWELEYFTWQAEMTEKYYKQLPKELIDPKKLVEETTTEGGSRCDPCFASLHEVAACCSLCTTSLPGSGLQAGTVRCAVKRQSKQGGEVARCLCGERDRLLMMWHGS